MTEEATIARQWVSMPGGSLDVRMGAGATEQIGRFMREATGISPRCLMYVDESTDADLVEAIRRELVNVGFGVAISTTTGEGRTLDGVRELYGALAEAGISADDCVFAVGGTDLLSTASFACATWLGGVALTMYPLDEAALLEATVLPRGIDFGGETSMVEVRPCAKRVICDLDVIQTDLEAESSRLARAIMVSAAVAESEKAFSNLWDRADDLMSGDAAALGTVLGDALKSRGHLVTSTALALRQSVTYGRDFVRAMRRVVPASVPTSVLLSEGLRFSARLAAGMEKFPVDDVFAQDDLLEALGLDEEIRCTVDPDDMIAALKAERFLRTNRFHLMLPQKLGRVRLTAVEDDLLSEHVGAWCDMRAGE